MPDSSSGSNGGPVLVDDVLLRILCECDISTVLVTGLASRALHVLSSSKQVWLTHLSDLKRRGFVDLPPHQRLENLNASELIDIAKHISTGPKSWSSCDPSPPVIARQIVLEPDIRKGPGVLYWENDARLIPGGRFLLFLNWGKLECWDITGTKLVWVYPCQWTHGIVQEYAMDVVDGGEAVTILVGVRTYGESRKNYFEVVRLDLSTYISTSLIDKAAPNTSVDNPFHCTKIQGDFAIMRMRDQPEHDWEPSSIVVVLRLSKTICSFIPFSESEFTSDITLIPGHVIGAYPSETGNFIETYKLTIWSMNDLLACQDISTDLVDYKPVATFTDTRPSNMGGSTQVILGSHLSPFHHDSTDLWLLWQAKTIQVHKFHISDFESPSITQTLSFSFQFGGSEFYAFRESFSISFAGYINLFHCRVNKILSLAGNMKDIDLSDSGDPINMSAYSGAITYATSERVIVNYYE